jgi:hypothetical protein
MGADEILTSTAVLRKILCYDKSDLHTKKLRSHRSAMVYLFGAHVLTKPCADRRSEIAWSGTKPFGQKLGGGRRPAPSKHRDWTIEQKESAYHQTRSKKEQEF